MIFDLVIPTYKRKDKLIRCLKSIPKAKNLTIWLYFDNQDFDTYEALIKTDFRFYSVIPNLKYQAFGCWNRHLLTYFGADVMIYLCDDTEWYPDLFDNLQKHFEEKFPDTDGVVTFKQANLKGSDSAMGAIGRKFAERYPNKQCFNPNYVSFYADSDIGDYAKKLGKFYYAEDCKIIHYHPVTGVEADETHKIIRGHDKTVDIKINKIRKEKGLLYPETLEMINRCEI